MKYDNDKAPLHLIPAEVLVSVATVLGFGAKKYGANNWREDLNEVLMSRNYSSLQRHLNQFWSGEDLDAESGLSHLDHALCQLIFLKVQHTQGNLDKIDDRFKLDMIKDDPKPVTITPATDTNVKPSLDPKTIYGINNFGNISLLSAKEATIKETATNMPIPDFVCNLADLPYSSRMAKLPTSKHPKSFAKFIKQKLGGGNSGYLIVRNTNSLTDDNIVSTKKVVPGFTDNLAFSAYMAKCSLGATKRRKQKTTNRDYQVEFYVGETL